MQIMHFADAIKTGTINGIGACRTLPSAALLHSGHGILRSFLLEFDINFLADRELI